MQLRRDETKKERKNGRMETTKNSLEIKRTELSLVSSIQNGSRRMEQQQQQ